MRSRPYTPSEAGDTLPGPRASPTWQHTGNGVLFFDTEQQHRASVAKARARSRHWTVAGIVLAVIVLGTTAAIAFDWLRFDSVVSTALPD